METGVDYVRRLCKEKNISVSKLEKDLEFSNGYLNPKKIKKLPYDRAVMIAEYLSCDINKIMNGEVETSYYINEETAEIAQKIYNSKELSALFDAARNAPPEDIMTAYDMLLALKRKEKKNID